METTATTGKNNLGHPGATAPGFMIGGWEYACREAIRLGEREARTAKQPQGPVPAVKEEVVFTSCHRCFHLFYPHEHSRVNRGR